MREIVSDGASGIRFSANCRAAYLRPRNLQQNGAVAVMFAGLLMLIFGFFGLALDLSRIYNRRFEMQAVADAVAISASKQLNGTQEGITAAIDVAHLMLEAGVVTLRPKYAYNETMVFSDAAIKFGKSADGSAGWLDEAAAKVSPDGLAYVKVETSGLDSRYGKVNMLFMPILSPSHTSVTVNRTAVAGRAGGIGVTPIAICAMSASENGRRVNPFGNDELVQYGFRRGVSYDLMKLSPSDDTSAMHFLVDPISPPGPGSPGSNFDLSTVGPHVCAGTVALPKIAPGSTIRVKSKFPIGDLYEHLNSRFNLSNGKCDPATAPPDSNIRQYPASGIGWMNPTPTGNQSAAEETKLDNKRQTIADLAPGNGQTTTNYGPLWVFARAVPWASYVSGEPEPTTGYAPFAATQTIWTSLYSGGPALTASAYPSPAGVTTPYSSQTTSPPATRPGTKLRRVLNVPLLQCPVSGSTAKVLAIGKFFMTVQASSSAIYGEFAGIKTDQPIVGHVELFE